MSINEAIERLEQAKQRGVKHMLFAWWEAEEFGETDDEQWAEAAEYAEDRMDWSLAHDCLDNLVQSYYDPEDN